MNDRWKLRLATLAAAALLLVPAGCTGALSPAIVPTVPEASGAADAMLNGRAVVTILVPKPSPSRLMRPGAKPDYVSSATKAMTVTFYRGGKIAERQVIALTPGSPGCSKVAAGNKCKYTIALKGCSNGANCYKADVVTFDAVTCKGKPATCSIPAKARQLSTEQKYPVGIFAGQTTVLTLALAGIPVATKIFAADALTRLNAGGVFDLIGPGAHALAVEFLDADGNTIVGSGSPALSLSRVSGGLSPVTVATPSPGSNEVYVTPPVAFDGTNSATFSVAPSFEGQATNGCGATNAKCTPETVTVDMVLMAAIARTGLDLYAVGSAAPLITLEGGNAGIAADPAGNLYTGYAPTSDGSPQCESGAHLGVYRPPLVEAATPAFLACGTRAIAQVPSQGAYVLLLTQYMTTYGTQFCSNATCTRSLSGLQYLDNAVAADGAGDVAANYLLPYSSACQVQFNTQVVSLPGAVPCAQSMAFDRSGDLFAIVPSNSEVVEISKSLLYTTEISTSPSVPYQLAVDGDGNVVVAGQNPVTLAATLQESLATTLSANQGGSITPDNSIVVATPPAGQGAASEAIAIAGETAYVQFSFLEGTTGNFAAFALPGLTQIGATTTNAATGATAMQVLP